MDNWLNYTNTATKKYQLLKNPTLSHLLSFIVNEFYCLCSTKDQPRLTDVEGL